jgi:hypothetical protein
MITLLDFLIWILFIYLVIWVIYKSIISFQKGRKEGQKELEDWMKMNK